LILDGHEALSDGIPIANVTILGINNATLDGSKMIYPLEIGNWSNPRKWTNNSRVTLKGIRFTNFPLIRSNADLILEDCHFVSSAVSLAGGLLSARSCTFEHGKLGTQKVTGVLTSCRFVGTCSEGNGGLASSDSNITLVDPANIAACGDNSTLSIVYNNDSGISPKNENLIGNYVVER